MEVELYKTKLQAAILDAQKCTQEKLQLQNEVICCLFCICHNDRTWENCLLPPFYDPGFPELLKHFPVDVCRK